MLAIFRKFLVLFICYSTACFGQVAETVSAIELGPTSFPIERPFAISVTIANSETRPVLVFPDIPGFVKKGILTSVTSPDINEKKAGSQIITQNYQARAAGRFILAPFTITVEGTVLRSEGAVLIVRASATASVPNTTTVVNNLPPPGGAAFMALRASKATVYTGEGVGLTLSFFVADNYPYQLNFTALDRQLQAIIKKIRPANAWEENRPITELKPVPVLIGGKKFREIQLYQSVFYPLATRLLTLPAVTLYLIRPRPKIGPPSAEAETERVLFSSKPLTIAVRALPQHPLRGQVAVGSFRLNEQLERKHVQVGQSIRYRFSIAGEGNIATLPAPVELAKSTDIDIFPPKEQHSLKHTGNQVDGQKTFTYFIVPRQNGTISLADHFQWIYFDPQRARYDTLRPRVRLEAGGADVAALATDSVPIATSAESVDGTLSASSAGRSLYTGISTLDSTYQPISIPVLIRSVANVLIVLMLLGMIFVFFRR
nr:BatD family protein [Spirosoma utsteinense]